MKLSLPGEFPHALIAAMFLATALSNATAAMVDPAEQIAEEIWKAAPAGATIYVNAKLTAGTTASQVNGTAFMISDVVALTAGHVVCDKNKERYTSIELRPGGIGASAIAPDGIVCFPDDIDIAIMKVPGLDKPRAHFEPGAYEDLKYEHFVTMFGYGGNQPGRHLKGNASFPVDKLNRVRTDLSAGQGDSGAPVLDRRGRAIGVLTAGYASTVAIVPLRLIAPLLDRFSIVVPMPTTQLVGVNSNVGQPALVRGVVRITLGRLADRSWPFPRTRLAKRDEAQVLLTTQVSGADPEAYVLSTADDGTWSAPLRPITKSGVQFSAIATQVDDLDRAPEAYAFRAEPIYGRIPPPLSTAVGLDLYARSAYVAIKFGVANQRATMLQSSSTWQSCGPQFEITPKPASSCSRAKLLNAKKEVSNIDQDFLRTLEASVAAPDDVEITIAVANAWSAFLVRTGRPCRAATILASLFDKSSAYASTSLFTQMVSATVQCQSIGDTGPMGQMSWRQSGETRQAASLRLMLTTMEAYFPDVSKLRTARTAILQDVTTAFEMYRVGLVQVSEAARVISASPALRDSLEQFV
jgi:hypothetical protein